jgi:hypothetical protein
MSGSESALLGVDGDTALMTRSRVVLAVARVDRSRLSPVHGGEAFGSREKFLIAGSCSRQVLDARAVPLPKLAIEQRQVLGSSMALALDEKLGR